MKQQKKSVLMLILSLVCVLAINWASIRWLVGDKQQASGAGSHQAYTELYIANHVRQIRKLHSGKQSISFTVSNHEGKPKYYHYQVLVGANYLATQEINGAINLAQETSKTILANVDIPQTSNPVKISIRLPELGQEVHVWYIGAQK